jgi:hypothetical protein
MLYVTSQKHSLIYCNVNNNVMVIILIVIHMFAFTERVTLLFNIISGYILMSEVMFTKALLALLVHVLSLLTNVNNKILSHNSSYMCWIHFMHKQVKTLAKIYIFHCMVLLKAAKWKRWHSSNVEQNMLAELFWKDSSYKVKAIAMSRKSYSTLLECRMFCNSTCHTCYSCSVFLISYSAECYAYLQHPV